MKHAAFVQNFYLLVAALIAVGHAAALEPRLKWSFNTGGKIYAPPLITDLEEDGNQEILLAASRDRRLICLDGWGGMKWDFALEDGNSDGFQAALSAVDYDGDGGKEIFFLTRGGTVGCVDRSGHLVWRVLLGDQMDYTGPVAADLNADGRIELVFGSESGTLYCLNDAGQVLWRRQRPGPIRGIPAVARLDKGPNLHIYATWSGGEEACYDAEGNVRWEFDEGLFAGERRSGVSIGDLDKDGRLETVSATEDYQVIARDADSGAERWRFKGQGRIDQTCSFALADFDGGGLLDVAGGDSSGRVYRIRNGAAVWTSETGGGIVQGPSVGDVDGDGILEILACSRSNRLVCLDGQTGALEWEYATPAAPLTTPALGDVDGDGLIEILFTSKDHSVYCLTVGGKAQDARLPWPMINRDAQLSGWMEDTARFHPAPFAERPEQFPAAIQMDESIALRTGMNRVDFEFANDSHRTRHLEVQAEMVLPDSSVMTRLYSEYCDPHAVMPREIRIAALQSGIYAVTLRLSDLGNGERLATLTRKIDFIALAPEKNALEMLRREAVSLLAGMGDPSLGQRAGAAFDRTFSEAQSALDAAAQVDPPLPEKIDAVHDALKRLEQDVSRMRAAPRAAEPSLFGLAAASPMVKVFRDEPYPSSAGAASELFITLARNEYESGQVVVIPLWADVRQLRVTATALAHASGMGAIDEGQIAVHRVGYVEIGPPEYTYRVEKTGWYPDPLLPPSPADIPAGQAAQPFYITVHTLPDTPPGMYEGSIIVEAEGVQPVTLPLKALVWDFELPRETTLKTSFWINEGYLRAFYGYPERTPEAVRKRYYDLHLEYRVGPVMALPLEGGDMVEDLEYVLSRGQNNFFVHLPDLFTEESRAEFKEKALRTRDLIREKGWEDKVMFYTHDETAVMARHLIPQVVEVNNWAKGIIPEWPRLQTSAPEQSLFGSVDIWCPTIDHFNPSTLKTRMDAGDRLWMYTVWGRPGIMIEFPSTDYRLMFWECWKYGAEGFLYWGTTHWGYNVEGEGRWPDRPWITYNSQPGHNGCGYLVYPGPDGTPLASLRLALVRDGIEDYEYFHLLRKCFQENRGNMTAAERETVEHLLAIDPEVVRDNQHFTEDPEALITYREQLAAWIEKLAQ